MPKSKLFQLLFPRFLRFHAVDDEGGGGSKTPPESQTFSLEYVKELRAENKGFRLKNQELEGKLKTAEDSVANSAKDVETKINEANTAANERILRAELKVKAKEAGLIDMDGLKLADLSKVSLKDDGSIDGADALFTSLKEAKPYLFGVANSSTPITPPAVTPPAQKLVKDMSKVEYNAAKAALLKQ
jgi:hypothetical protein